MKKGINSFARVLGVVALNSFFLIACENQKKPEAPIVRPVKAIVVTAQNNVMRRSFPGRAQADQEVDLSFKVPGLLIERPIQVGALVQQGQLIAQLDSREFVARLSSAQAEAKRDEQNLRRAQQLIKGGHISQSDYELLKTKSTVSNTNVDLAKKALTDTVLKAPFTGRIASISVKNHQTVTANQTIARILDTSHIDMVVQIPETIISRIAAVTDITVQFDAFPQVVIPATIKDISYEASTDTRTYPVTLTMKQPTTIEILPGMAGNASGNLASQSKSSKTLLTLPRSALFSPGIEKKTYVWIIDKKTKKIHRQLVIPGALTATGVSVSDGIKPGDLVVIAGVHSLQDGDVVTLLNPQDK
ncbi:MAG: efflux RND transporter periplasmic adaptor subunit [Legionella sp.]|uniref:efflux RND transporter periplasmic adaptor subunit n=1 Tax=Legionella sp. TaxID=459 RepID=UPI00284582F4|nr:efflux RND transporter periplasmic adaptor subunit [Legionella sp.]